MAPSATPRKQPPSVDDILRDHREKQAASAKPRYIPKAERERIALEKRKKEVEEAQKRREASSGDDRIWKPSQDGSSQNGAPSIPAGPRVMRDAPTEPSSMRDRRGDMAPPPPPPSENRKSKRPAEDIEAIMIRERYLGPEANKSTFSAVKKRQRTTEKKFNFEWDSSEDTSHQSQLIPQSSANGRIVGRGIQGGFHDDVKTKATQMYAQMIAKEDPVHGQERAQQLLEMDRRRQQQGGRAQLDKHWSEKRLEYMRERDWRIFKEEFGITTKGGAIPNPMRNWGESGLPDELMHIIDQVGYVEPSPIQRAAIPIALQCRDLIGVARTGSGKTAAFVLPLLAYIMQLPRLTAANLNDGPYALILAPTRELAQQIEAETRKFAAPLGFNTAVLVGGHQIEEQAFQMRDGAEVVIATPGRLVDCLERHLLVLNQCTYVIMDEADKMIDMGFEEPVNKILEALPVNNEKPDDNSAEDGDVMRRGMYRQTMMYTATMAPALERIATQYLRRPAMVTVGNQNEATDTVIQRAELIEGEDNRKRRLQEILTSGQFKPPIIVFNNNKRGCDALARDIQRMGFSATTLHGSKTQEQREAALASLKSGKSSVMVATDLAGRGLDIDGVSLVVNFTMASTIEAYTHRIGRTGRLGADKHGVAITFWGKADAEVLYELKKIISKSEISRLPEELRNHPLAQQKGNKKGEMASRHIT